MRVDKRCPYIKSQKTRVTDERKRLAVASQILRKRQHIKHSCKSRRLTYPFRGFNYLRGNVAAGFRVLSMVWQPARHGNGCISISSRISIKPCDVSVYFRTDVFRSRKTRIMKKRDCRQFYNRISMCVQRITQKSCDLLLVVRPDTVDLHSFHGGDR